MIGMYYCIHLLHSPGPFLSTTKYFTNPILHTYKHTYYLGYIGYFSGIYNKDDKKIQTERILTKPIVHMELARGSWDGVRAVDPHSFYADPDPADFLNADPDPGPGLA